MAGTLPKAADQEMHVLCKLPNVAGQEVNHRAGPLPQSQPFLEDEPGSSHSIQWVSGLGI